MISNFNLDRISDLVKKQLSNFFPHWDGQNTKKNSRPIKIVLSEEIKVLPDFREEF